MGSLDGALAFSGIIGSSALGATDLHSVTEVLGGTVTTTALPSRMVFIKSFTTPIAAITRRRVPIEKRADTDGAHSPSATTCAGCSSGTRLGGEMISDDPTSSLAVNSC